MNWVIIYDISDKKRLSKVARIMRDYGVRVQRSVFESDISLKKLNELRKKILKVINVEEDYVVYFNLCEADWQKRVKYGKQFFGQLEENDYFIL